ncbi:MAG: hypothetical protein Fur0021_36640 [Candidatus Promineifilaceae bacterium]
MENPLHFTGYIRNVVYKACLADDLTLYDYANFDINYAKSFGAVQFGGAQIAYSKWLSPKRTRSYPFERIYNTYNSPKVMTIVPILKDEGWDGDLDRIQYSTVSWMNLLNIYIVLTYYRSAEKNLSKGQRGRHKLTNQRFDTQLVNEQIEKIFRYRQSALHWNRDLLEERFTGVYKMALDSYETISSETGVRVHDREPQLTYLHRVIGDFEQFRDISLQGSRSAAQRETLVTHKMEYLSDGTKGVFHIKNYLGGVYHLTADEVVLENDRIVIQESKNSTRDFLPSLSDIKDGLFKLILFANLDSLWLDEQPVRFSTRLKLTGQGVSGSIRFPCPGKLLQDFMDANSSKLTQRQKKTLDNLNVEANENKNLEIEITGNT